MIEKCKDNIKLVKIMILQNRKIYGLSIAFLTLGLSFWILMTCLCNSVVNKRQADIVDQYGEYVSVIADLNNDEIKLIKDEMKEFDYYEFQLSDVLLYEDVNYTLGIVNQEAAEGLGIKLLYGSQPANSEEAIVEEFVANKLNIKEDMLPYRISLQTAEKQYNLVICGIVENYSNYLTAYQNLIIGLNNYPNIICGGELSEEKNKSLILCKNKIEFSQLENEFIHIMNKLYDLNMSEKQFCMNEHLYVDGYQNIVDIISACTYYKIFLSFILGAIFLVLMKVLLYQNKYIFALYHSLGISRRRLDGILFQSFLLVMISSFLCSILLLMAINFFVIKRCFGAYYSEYNHIFYNKAGTTFILILLVSASIYGIIKFLKNGDIVSSLRKKEKLSSVKYKFKRFSIKLVIISAIVISFICASFQFLNQFSYIDDFIKYSLFSKSTFSFKDYNNYDIANYDKQAFPLSIDEYLKQYEDDMEITLHPEMKLATLLIENGHMDSYFQELIESNTFENSEIDNTIADKKLMREANEYKAMPARCINFIVYTEKEMKQYIKEQNLDIEESELNKKKSCIISIPDYNTANSHSAISEKSYITIGGIWQVNDELNFMKEEFQVVKLLTPSTSDNTRIKIIISEEQAKKSRIIIGYDLIDMILNKDIDSHLLKEIENMLNEIIASSPGGFLDSSIAMEKEDAFYRNYTGVLCYTIILFGVFAVCLCMIYETLLDWEKNKKDYAVLRIIGMSFRQLKHRLFAGFINSILIGSLVGMGLCYMLFPHSTNIEIEILIAAVVTILIAYACRYLLFRQFVKQTVCGMLKD